MAYLGKGTKSIDHATISTHTMTGDGSDTTMSITLGTTSVNNVSVFISGVQQRPGQDYNIANDVITFTTAPAAGWPVIVFVRKDTKKGTIADASVGLDTIKDGAVTDAKILGLSASKLSGALPALDGSALTGISAVTTSTVDPATDTNFTLGAVWVNKTSGNTFVCTDATTDANVWTNVGSGSGNVAPYYNSAGGTVAGYAVGGWAEPPSTGTLTAIDKYAFASGSSNAVDHGDLVTRRSANTGNWSATHGYSSGGYLGSSQPKVQTVDKFAFAGSNVTATNIGNLNSAGMFGAGCSSETDCYHCGSYLGSGSYDNGIDKIVFSSDSVSHNVGSLNSHANVENINENYSTTDGYVVGGDGNNKIDSFSFASEGQTSLVGTLTQNRGQCSSQNTETHGYSAGGYNTSNGSTLSSIEKFAFGSSVTSTARSNDLTAVRRQNGGFTSTSHGYSCGGTDGGGDDTIERFSTASDTATEDISNLSFCKMQMSTAQN